MAKIHDRIVEIVFTADCSGHTVAVSGLNYYRTRAKLEDSKPFAITYSPTTAQSVSSASAEIALGELLPPPTVIRLTPTGI